MKTTNIFKTLLLVLLLAAGNSHQAMAQTDSCAVNVIHTYMNGRPVQWDSVEIKVCEPPCERPYHYHTFMLYWPDTLLTNCATNIEEYTQAKDIDLSQNFPNPCLGRTQVNLTTSNIGMVHVRITDMQGRTCFQRTLNLPSGEHLLSLQFPRSGFYIVLAETERGSKVCKVLCMEGQGKDYDVAVTSNITKITEKTAKGGEGLFNITDKMWITAYITHNGSVLTYTKTVNHNYTLEGYEFSVWMYNYGSINFFFKSTDSNMNITFEDNTYKLIVSSQTCLPFVEFPIGYTINFGDSIFYSQPESFYTYASSTWHFDGWYKYRYYPELGNAFAICNMEETLPEHPTAYGRYLIVTSNKDAIIYTSHPYLGGEGYEYLILDE